MDAVLTGSHVFYKQQGEESSNSINILFYIVFYLIEQGELSNFIWNAIPNFKTGEVKAFF